MDAETLVSNFYFSFSNRLSNSFLSDLFSFISFFFPLSKIWEIGPHLLEQNTLEKKGN